MTRAGALALLAIGCARVDGDLRIDGREVAFTRCVNLEVIGIEGIDADLDDGRTLRLFAPEPPLLTVGFFDDPDSDLGALLGLCAEGALLGSGTFTQEVEHLRADVTLSCRSVFDISGDLSLRGCGPGPGYRRGR